MAEANEATVAQIAAHRPSESSNTMNSEARLVTRKTATAAADPRAVAASLRGLWRSVE
jgi:hypothetical protein